MKFSEEIISIMSRIKNIVEEHIDMYEKACPFCGQKHKKARYINIICSCGSKYYYMDKLWLDRKTGVRIADTEDGHIRISKAEAIERICGSCRADPDSECSSIGNCWIVKAIRQCNELPY